MNNNDTDEMIRKIAKQIYQLENNNIRSGNTITNTDMINKIKRIVEEEYNDYVSKKNNVK